MIRSFTLRKFASALALMILSGCSAINGITGTTISGRINFVGIKQQNVQLQSDMTSIHLTWDAPTHYQGSLTYYIFSDAGFTNVIDETPNNYYDFENPVLGKTYVFGVRAKDDIGFDNNRALVVTKIPLQVPDFNGITSISAVSDSKIQLSWNPSNSFNLQSYEVYYSKDLSNPLMITNDTQVLLTGLTPSSLYSFVVRAKNSYNVEDANTVIKSATTLSGAYPDFAGLSSVTQVSGNAGTSQLQLNWSPAGGNVTGYRIYRGTSPRGEDFTTPIAAVGSASDANGAYVSGQTKAFAIVDGLQRDTLYYFVVRAFYNGAQGTVSELNSIEKFQSTLINPPPPVKPTISSVVPAAGPLAGSTPIKITGTGFATGASVMIGAASCAQISVNSATSISCLTPQSLNAAPVSVVVTNTDTGSATKLNGYNYTTVPAPSLDAITPISPSSGPLNGSQFVTINGAGFVDGASVTVGPSSCTGVTVSTTGTSLTCTTSSGPAGAAAVKVTNPDTQSVSASAIYTFKGAPTISNVAPATGPFGGGTTLTISGANFQGNLTVTVNGAPCKVLSVATDTVLCSSPQNATNTTSAVNVYLRNPDGQDYTAAGAFTYVPAPTVTGILPGSGSVGGSTKVAISGTGFATGILVTIGGSACNSVTVSDTSNLTCTTTAHAEGTVPVSVSLNNQTGTSATNIFSYQQAPAINTVSPSYGPPSGGTSITISGNAFYPGSTVSLGSNSCDGVVVADDHQSLTCTTRSALEGAVSVTVRGSDGNSITKANGFYFTANSDPTVSGVSPIAGASTGGTTITVSGTNFTSGATVTVGSTPCNSVQFVNSSTLTCSTPGGSGSVAVSVQLPTSQKAVKGAAFSYSTIVPPAVTSVTPNFGPLNGATVVEVDGTGFGAGATVTIDDLACSPPPSGGMVISSSRIKCVIPAHVAATGLTVRVTNTDSQSGKLASAFTYQGPPSITSVLPATGSLAGGDLVSITGQNFSPGLIIYFGSAACSNLSIQSATQATCNTPSSASAVVVGLTATNIDTQSSVLSNAYTYTVNPSVFALEPAYGLTGGGYTVTVRGTGFLNSLKISIGSADCTNVAVLSPFAATCRVPVSSPGTFDVTISNGGAQNSVLAGGFTYGTVSNIYLNWTESTLLAGVNSSRGYLDGKGTSVRYNSPYSTAVIGNTLYIADYSNQLIRKMDIDPNSPTLYQVSTVVGKPGAGGCINGTGTASKGKAQLAGPAALTTDGTYLYIGEAGCYSIRRYNPKSDVLESFVGASTVAQTAPVDAAGQAARMNPVLALTYRNGLIYFASTRHPAIRQTDLSGNVKTLAGPMIYSIPATTNSPAVPQSGYQDSTDTNTPADVRFSDNISGFEADSNYLYISDTGNNRIRRYNLQTGKVTSWAGTGNGGLTDSTVDSADMNSPTNLLLVGNILYFSQYRAIRSIDLSKSPQTTNTVTGQWSSQANSDGSFVDGLIYGTDSNGISYHAASNRIFFPATSANAVRQLDFAQSTLTTVSGVISPNGNVDGDALSTRFSYPFGAVRVGDYVYTADTNNNLIRRTRISDGYTERYAGGGTSPYADGARLNAGFASPVGLTTDGAALYVADRYSIRRIDLTTGLVKTLAGNLYKDGWADGPGNQAIFYLPVALATDGQYLYIAEYYGGRIRRLDLSDKNYTVSTVAGSTTGVKGYANGVGTAVLFNSPGSIVYLANALYVGDSNEVIRKIDLSSANYGNVTVVAGFAGSNGSVDGVGGRLGFTRGLTTDGSNIYIADIWQNRIRYFDTNSGVLGTIMNSDFYPSDNDSLLPSARVSQPMAINFSNGQLYFTTPSAIRQVQ